MKEKILRITNFIRRKRLEDITDYLLRDEAISGKLILIALALALIAANTPLVHWYESFLHTKFVIGFGDFNLALDLKHWVSEGLMAFFFLVVGLELKRELLHGELKHRQTAILPFAAAVGGMLVPALIFILFNFGRETISGWAIPTATDIALAVGVLALLGDRIPRSVRVFILALAIVDDILAVIIIAVFYSASLNIVALAAVAAVAALTYLLGRKRLLAMWMFILAGIVLWLLTLESGIHPSIAGVILGMIAPMAGHKQHEEYIAERAERAIIPFTTLAVVPLFAFVSTGISLDVSKLQAETVATLGGGIFAGLVLGKLLGIFSASWLMVKMGLARLPSHASWGHIVGVGSLAGIGFTVAIFVTDLSFADEAFVATAKLSIIVASTVSALAGLLILRRVKA